MRMENSDHFKFYIFNGIKPNLTNENYFPEFSDTNETQPSLLAPLLMDRSQNLPLC